MWFELETDTDYESKALPTVHVKQTLMYFLFILLTLTSWQWKVSNPIVQRRTSTIHYWDVDIWGPYRVPLVVHQPCPILISSLVHIVATHGWISVMLSLWLLCFFHGLDFECNMGSRIIYRSIPNITCFVSSVCNLSCVKPLQVQFLCSLKTRKLITIFSFYIFASHKK